MGDTVLQVLAGRRQRAKAKPRGPKGIVGNDGECGIMGLLRQAQQGVSELVRRVELWPYHIKPPQPKQDLDQLWRLAPLLTQRAGLVVGILHLRRCVPFGHLQCRAQGDVQGHGVLGPLGRLWLGREQLDAGGQMANGFYMGRAVAGTLARPLPVEMACSAQPAAV